MRRLWVLEAVGGQGLGEARGVSLSRVLSHQRWWEGEELEGVASLEMFHGVPAPQKYIRNYFSVFQRSLKHDVEMLNVLLISFSS